MSDLIPGMNLPEFLARRNQMLDGYRRAFEALLDADEQAKQAGLDDFPTLEGYSVGRGGGCGSASVRPWGSSIAGIPRKRSPNRSRSSWSASPLPWTLLVGPS